ncbi:hypothetical protein L3Q82_017038 [Scortum barcoo]|uniref:Uncharacterized protein n=1 Tax=Scortum barcoo TaxID=214431 RepID=A0ACB8X9T7_9TELE|nr:hypothetical protein L3Q82_017038 [Scortum barcoo]
MEVGDSASGVANQGWWSLFLKRGIGECVPTTGDHTSQPPQEGLRQGTGERIRPIDRTLRIQEEQCCQGPEGVRFGNHRISSLLFADDVVLLASSSQDLQRVLERFAAECEAAGMRINTSKSEAMVLDRKRVACPLRVGGEVLPQVEEFKYLGVLFTGEGKMEREIDMQVGPVRTRCGEEEAEP